MYLLVLGHSMQRALLRFQSGISQLARSTLSQRNTSTQSIFGNKIRKYRTNKSSRWPPNGRILSAAAPSSSVKFALLRSHIRCYSSKNNANAETDSATLYNKAIESINQSDHYNALNYAIKALEKSQTPQQIFDALKLKTDLAIYLETENWVDEFVGEVKRLESAPEQFESMWLHISATIGQTYKTHNASLQKIYDKAFKAFPNNYTVTWILGENLIRYDKLEEALFYLRKATTIDPNRSIAWCSIWFFTDSEEAFKNAKNCPDVRSSVGKWLALAEHFIFNVHDYEAGFALIQRSLALVEFKEEEIRKVGRVVMTLVHQEDYELAEKIVQEWIAASPTSADPWLILGSIQSARESLQDAEHCFRKAIEYDPNCSAAWANLGNILPPAEGIPMLLKAIELEPNSSPSYAMLAAQYTSAYQHELALKAINRAIELNSDDTRAHELKAIICAKLKQ